MKKKIFIAAAVIISTTAQAQTIADSSKTLDELVFTAGKYPQKQIGTGKVVTIITKAQLEKSGGKSVAEILQQQAGIIIPGANNNAGTNQTVNIRGASAGNALILVDGIPVNDPSVITNYYDINFFATTNIERIEILKGGQSTLYGSDAVAGVINIITMATKQKPFYLNGGVAGGSYNTFREFVNIGGGKKWGSYSLAYSNMNSTGFSSAYDSTGIKNFDNDKFNQHSLNSSIQFNLNKKNVLKLFGNYSYYKAGLDAAAFTDEKDFTAKNNNVQAGVGFINKHNNGSLHVNYAYNFVKRNYVDDSAYKSSPFVDYSKSDYKGITHFAEFYDNWQWKNYELMLGIDHRSNKMESYSLYVFPGFPTPASTLDTKMNQTSPYASFIYKNKNGFTAEAGSRLNIHSVYGSNVSFSLNPSFLLHNQYKFFGNLYSAYKTPTLYQLYDASYGNTSLNPENGLIAEAGAELLQTNGFTARLVGFYRNTKDKIEFIITNPITYASQYQNISRQKNYGAELELAYQQNSLSASANYTYTDGSTKAAFDGTGFPMGKDTTYNNLYRIPKHAVNLQLGYQFTEQFYANASLRYAGKRQEFVYGAKPLELKSYSVIDIYAEYKYGRTKFFIDARNIANEKYFDLTGYAARKFNWMAGVNISL